MPRLIVHIGMSKAGSSAIQRACVNNEVALRDLGFCYPMAGRIGQSHYKIMYELKDLAHPETLLRAFEESKDSESMIVSAEGFWLFGADQVAWLEQHVDPAETTIVLYLRNPQKYLCSSFRQGIKNHRRPIDQDQYIHRFGDRIEYPRVVEDWGSRFKLNVRVYDLVRGKLEQDFFQGLGIKSDDLRLDREVVNRTPSDGTIRAISFASRRLPQKLHGSIVRGASWLDWCLKCLPGIKDDQIAAFGREAIQGWDTGVLRKYLSEEEIRTLVNAPHGCVRTKDHQ